MGLREIKHAARRGLHKAMQVPAFYIEDPAADPLPEPVACTVRVHLREDALGELKGTSFDYAEKHEFIPKLIFLVEEVALPERGAAVTITDPVTKVKEAYLIDNRHQPDGITVTAEVTTIAPADYGTLPFPP